MSRFGAGKPYRWQIRMYADNVWTDTRVQPDEDGSILICGVQEVRYPPERVRQKPEKPGEEWS